MNVLEILGGYLLIVVLTQFLKSVRQHVEDILYQYAFILGHLKDGFQFCYLLFKLLVIVKPVFPEHWDDIIIYHVL